MAVRKKGKAPAAKGKSAKADTAAVVENVTVLDASNHASAKLTVSIKRRLSNGDEVFIAPGIEQSCSADALDATQEEVSTRVHAWLDELLAQYPDEDPIEAADDEDEDEDEAEDEDEDEDEDEADEEELTEEDVKKLKKAELTALAAEYEIELESTKVAEMRTELIEALFEEEEEGDEDEDEDEDEADEDEADDEEDEAYTAAELKENSLEELQDIADSWEMKHPKLKKGAKLSEKKKAYIKAILAFQNEE